MASVEKTIDVDVPVRTAYDQWTQFEMFPVFMEGVDEVRQIDDTHMHWKATFVAGQTKEWNAEITQQSPDDRIAWRSTDGAPNTGMIRFDKIHDGATRLTLEIEYEPEGLVENVGSHLGVMSRRVEGDLKRFKEFIEKRGTETGAWRGEVS
ncbi:MAG TPA: SRPBCC family protein [Thermomicrobiales bacterium]|jgi:uncharacterized membrane protein|nr:SRPBCC family protein [Thermomicrobiales bacterium]